MSVLRRNVFHTFIYMIGLMANRGMAVLVLLPFLTRTLVPKEIAEWELSTTTIFFLLPFFEIGMNAALMRYYHLFNENNERQRVVLTSFAVVTSLSVVLMAATIAFSKQVAMIVFSDDSATDIVQMLAVTCALMAVSNQQLAVLRAQEKSVQCAALGLLRSSIAILVTIALVKGWNMGVRGVLWGDLIGIAIMMFGGMITNRSWISLKSALDLSLARSMVVFALPLLFAAVTAPVITSLDRYFVRAWLGMDSLAVYSVGTKSAMIIVLFTKAFHTGWYSTAFQLTKEHDQGADGFPKLFRYVVAGMGSVAFALSLASPEIVAFFGGKEVYREAASTVAWISYGFTLYLLMQYVTISMAITNKTSWLVLVNAAGCLTKIVLVYLLIPKYGIVGAAASTFVAFAVQFAVGVYLSQKIYYIQYPMVSIMLFGMTSATFLILASAYDSLALRVLLGIIYCASIVYFGLVTTIELRQGWLALHKRFYSAA